MFSAMSLSSDASAITSYTSDPDEDVSSSLYAISPTCTPDVPVCFTCCDIICDQYYLRAGDHVWHEECMHCCACQVKLEGHSSCFYRDGNIFCRRDFNEIFQNKCNTCSRSIQTGDWVRSAGQYLFHLACFACAACHRQLSTGEDFAIYEGEVLCRIHALHPDLDDLNNKEKSKRFRTAFTDHQMSTLQQHFDANMNPSGADLERIGKEAGLTKRVAKVWFQNSRAKAKKVLDLCYY